MKKLLIALWALSVISAVGYVSAGEACLGTEEECSTTTTVTVTIEWGDICIWSEDTFNFGTFTASGQNQVTSWQFTQDRYVDDQKGSNSGYYTTVQISDLVDSSTSQSIPAINVALMSSFSVSSTVGTVPLLGSVNTRVYTSNDVLNTPASLDQPREFINRDAAANSWVLGKYGEKPYLQLTIPAYTSVGTYQGTITYTLYEPVN